MLLLLPRACATRPQVSARSQREPDMGETRNEQIRLPAKLGEPARAPLRADDLLESALRRGKRRDFADRSFIRPFEHLLKACNEEADLSLFGIRALRVDL